MENRWTSVTGKMPHLEVLFYVFWPMILKTVSFIFCQSKSWAFFRLENSSGAPKPPFLIVSKMHFLPVKDIRWFAIAYQGDYEKFCGNYESSSQSEPQFILCLGDCISTILYMQYYTQYLLPFYQDKCNSVCICVYLFSAISVSIIQF